jgi:hypothetical protein
VVERFASKPPRYKQSIIFRLFDGLDTGWKSTQPYSTIGVSLLIFGNPNSLLAIFGNEGNNSLKSRLNLQLVEPYM